jgi:hypothetical protein
MIAKFCVDWFLIGICGTILPRKTYGRLVKICRQVYVWLSLAGRGENLFWPKGVIMMCLSYFYISSNENWDESVLKINQLQHPNCDRPTGPSANFMRKKTLSNWFWWKIILLIPQLWCLNYYELFANIISLKTGKRHRWNLVRQPRHHSCNPICDAQYQCDQCFCIKMPDSISSLLS